ncbi:unnamed protein product (macronuclear) [Paramecium tetraurelia]|uniref:Uncharacterized protein n=1 Tax=Paramecium tetraurelia TaxID=5888 RepID=A0CNW5_PARTE|nr:uncharacterized protein GSPATT00038751001 [Paramecium tetraurelia]CAK72482.1 unnamed protein product [Paramecium tetraurelia]|eukprot:XP_001439879.1 hypothetical protein (macronuclear) [Paramecium tetraurelia strain d4-2]
MIRILMKTKKVSNQLLGTNVDYAQQDQQHKPVVLKQATCDYHNSIYFTLFFRQQRGSGANIISTYVYNVEIQLLVKTSMYASSLLRLLSNNKITYYTSQTQKMMADLIIIMLKYLLQTQHINQA